MEIERRDVGSAKEDGETGEWVTGSPEARWFWDPWWLDEEWEYCGNRWTRVLVLRNQDGLAVDIGSVEM